MVGPHASPRRHGVAMIELIFAITIMGIAIMAAPMLISTASDTVSVALQQEAIHEAASRTAMIMTYEWDENASANLDNPPILTTDSPVAALQNRLGRAARKTTYNGSTFSAVAPASLGSDTNDHDDIDDFIGDSNLTLVNETVTSGEDYLEQDTVKITTQVYYIDDNVSGSAGYGSATIDFNPNFTTQTNRTNIKAIVVSLTSTSASNILNDKNITLKAFSCNIGGFKYYSKDIP